VQTARNIQTKRYSSNELSNIVCNADMPVGEIRQFCIAGEESQRLMRAAMTRLNQPARAYHRTQSVKLARTIADLAGSGENQSVHLAEALHATQSSKIDAKLGSHPFFVSYFLGRSVIPVWDVACKINIIPLKALVRQTEQGLWSLSISVDQLYR
jgi:hypothetical protein